MAMVSWRGRAALAKHSPQRACAPDDLRKSATCARPHARNRLGARS